MADYTIHLASLMPVADRVLRHIRQGHDTALVGPPGCGITSGLDLIKDHIAREGYAITYLDMRKQPFAEAKREIEAPANSKSPLVFVVDHASDLGQEQFTECLKALKQKSLDNGSVCLWCGPLDARWSQETLGMKLCSVPSAHVTYPSLSRDELVSVYRAMAAHSECRWGEAILYLMLDLCGTDLTLVKSATDYLHGDWISRLYDENVWDGVQQWLKNDDTVGKYRNRLKKLPPSCGTTLSLIRFGGKPQCLRAELIEETDDGLRRLCLDGFIIPNLLPGFYQLRSLVVRFLLDESVRPELLYRRATNERAAALLQDAETMLRQVLASVFAKSGVDAARNRLEALQQPGEVIDAELNRSLLTWARESCSAEAVKSLNMLVLQHRTDFKKANSVWETATAMMQKDGVHSDGSPHIPCIDYLTFDQLGQLILGFNTEVFPLLDEKCAKERRKESRFRCASEPADLMGNWRADMAKIRRLRNQVAHLRNVGFQDMEDLARTLERMRVDLILYGGGTDANPEIAVLGEPATLNKE